VLWMFSAVRRSRTVEYCSFVGTLNRKLRIVKYCSSVGTLNRVETSGAAVAGQSIPLPRLYPAIVGPRPEYKGPGSIK